MNPADSADSETPGTIGGVVLCGGQSQRMGTPKFALRFGAESLLERVVGVLQQVVRPVVVVAAPGQDLGQLPSEVIVVRDPREGLGPLAGIALGLESLASCRAAYVSACDVPLLNPAFVRAVITQLGEADAAVVGNAEFVHPLAGVYRTALSRQAWELIDQQRLRPLFLLQACRCQRIPEEWLRQVDPDLESLENMNTPQDYERLLRRAGFSR
jgi:molybdopterin-guanine dinucleotide biosynthesis protein A